MMAWTLLTPRVHELVNGQRHAHTAIGISNLQDRPGHDLADGVDQLERITRVELRQVQQRHRTLTHVEINPEPMTRFAVVDFEMRETRLAFRQGDVARAVVAHE